MKKVLAVALSGVMALSMLTACDGGDGTKDVVGNLNDKLGYNVEYKITAANKAAKILTLKGELSEIKKTYYDDVKDLKLNDKESEDYDDDVQKALGAYIRADRQVNAVMDEYLRIMTFKYDTDGDGKLNTLTKADILGDDDLEIAFVKFLVEDKLYHPYGYTTIDIDDDKFTTENNYLEYDKLLQMYGLNKTNTDGEVIGFAYQPSETSGKTDIAFFMEGYYVNLGRFMGSDSNTTVADAMEDLLDWVA